MFYFDSRMELRMIAGERSAAIRDARFAIRWQPPNSQQRLILSLAIKACSIFINIKFLSNHLH